MKNVKVLGGGCSKCVSLADSVNKAAAELGVKVELEKITDIQKIMSYSVMSTPALVVDGKVVSAGKVLDVEQVKNFLK